MVDLKSKNHMAEAQLSDLEISRKQIEKYSYFKSVAASVVPDDKDQAQAVLDISQMADQSGILLQAITFPTSTLGLKSTSSSSSSSSLTSKNAISQAIPVKGSPGLYSLQLTITPRVDPDVPFNRQVTYAKIVDFLRRIENDRRTAQITQLTIQPPSDTSGSNQINFTLILNIFIKP